MNMHIIKIAGTYLNLDNVFTIRETEDNEFTFIPNTFEGEVTVRLRSNHDAEVLREHMDHYIHLRLR